MNISEVIMYKTVSSHNIVIENNTMTQTEPTTADIAIEPVKVEPPVKSINSIDKTQNNEIPDIAKFRKIPFWAALTSYIIGCLWVSGIVGYESWMPYHGRITMFTATFFIWAELTMKSIPRPGKECWFWMACALCIAIGMDLPRSPQCDLYLDPSPMMSGWNYFALHCIAIYWILCRSGKLIENKTGTMFLLDGLTGCIIAPFRGIPNRIKTIIYSIKEHNAESRKNVAVSIIALAICLPILYKVILLLGEADNVFNDIIKNIRDFSPLHYVYKDFFNKFIPGIFVSAYIFGLLSNCILSDKPIFSAPKIHKSMESFRSIPTMACMVILSSFITVYLLFFKIQGAHLLSAFWGVIPDDLTASEFARHGFFELCTVMSINFGLFFGMSKLCKTPLHENKKLKITTLLLISESILLAITAASKLILYIERFGFTTLRLLSIWGILVLTYGCILTIIGIIKNKTYVDKWIWGSVATFVPLCFF